MKTRILVIAITTVLLLMIVPAVFADQDPNDLGVQDTVRIGTNCPEFGEGMLGPFDGDSIGIPIYVWLDRECRGFSLGIVEKTGSMRPSSMTYDGTLLSPVALSFINYKFDETVDGDSGVLFGWADFTFGANAIQPMTTDKAQLLGHLNFQIEDGVDNLHIDLDSVFILPAGPFVLNVDIDETAAFNGASAAPYFTDCGEHDVLLEVVDLGSPTLPKEFTLSQNWPNPFNPTTSIDFSLPKSAHVKLEVINLLGQTINTLIDEDLTAGYKRIEWNGTNFDGKEVASGVYFYKIVTEDFTQTKKMMLLK